MLSFQVESMLMWKVQHKAMGGGGKKNSFVSFVLSRVFSDIFFSLDVNNISVKDFVTSGVHCFFSGREQNTKSNYFW